MPYKLDVLVDRRVLYLSTKGVYSNEEVREVIGKAKAFLDAVEEDHTGILIGNFTKQTAGPTNFIELRNDSAQSYKHLKHGVTVFYGLTGEQKIATFFINMLATIFKEPTKILSTEEDAVQFLITKFPELSHILPEALKAYHANEGW